MTAPDPCRRCKSPESVIVVRTEALCSACFEKYIHTKVVKRLETFRVKNTVSAVGPTADDPGAHRRVLLPLSLGLSSLTLLHVLDRHLARQRARTGHTGFTLHLVHVHSPGEPAPEPALARVRARFPAFPLAVRPLEAVWPAVRAPGSAAPLDSFLGSLGSTTARADLAAALRRRLVLAHAADLGAHAVLWGHTSTRIAEGTLAEAAKGRGGAVTRLFADDVGPAQPATAMATYFPLRDLMRKEIVAHGELVEPALGALAAADHGRGQSASEQEKPGGAGSGSLTSGSSSTLVVDRSTTIDSLMGAYMETVEAGFPSIVSNVVRTIEKLDGPVAGGRECVLCGLPVQEHGEEEEEESAAGVAGDSERRETLLRRLVCYGCRMNLTEPAAAMVVDGRQLE